MKSMEFCFHTIENTFGSQSPADVELTFDQAGLIHEAFVNGHSIPLNEHTLFLLTLQYPPRYLGRLYQQAEVTDFDDSASIFKAEMELEMERKAGA